MSALHAVPDNTNDPVPGLVLHLVELQERASTIDDEVRRVKAELARRLPDGTTEVGPVKVIITKPRRLNTAAAEGLFPPETFARLYESKLSTTKLKALLDLTPELDRPDLWAIGARQVTIK